MPTPSNAVPNEEKRTRAIWTLLLAFVMTPILLFPHAVDGLDAGTFDGATVAVPVGLALGVVAAVLLYDLDLDDVNQAIVLVAISAFIVVGTALVVTFVPRGAMPAFTLGVVAFGWALGLTGVARYVLWPRVRPASG